MDELGFNAEYEALKVRRDVLREQYADQIEMLAHLENVEKPAIESQYMLLVGQFEYRIYELKIEIRRWKRRFEMRQRAINRNEKPDLLAIEAALDTEFAEFAEAVQKHLDEIKKAVLYADAEKLSEEESNKLRLLYHDAAKKLHPDLNPEQDEREKNLWVQIQTAYNDKNWDKFRFLVGLADGVVAEKATFDPGTDCMAQLQEAITQLQTKLQALHDRICDMKGRKPFIYEAFLADPKQVEERQGQLCAQITMLEKYVREYEELWKHGQ